MKKLTLTLATLSIAVSSALVSTSAQAELSANVAATNNYLWRGLEQTGGAAAISGGIDYASESGFYVGTWASNASWGDMKTEVDIYFGYSGAFSDTVSYDVGYIYYAYPDSAADQNDFSEFYGSVSTGGFTFGLALLADAEAGGDDAEVADSVYASVDYALALESGAELGFHFGDYSGAFSTKSKDYGVSISKDNFTFGVSQSDFDDGADSDDLKFYVSYSVDIAL